MTYFLLLYAVAAAFILGFLLGRSKEARETVKEEIYQGKEFIGGILPDKTVKPGVIHRPSAQELANRNQPKAVREAKEAIKESLDKIPELQEHKKLISEYNKGVKGIYK